MKILLLLASPENVRIHARSFCGTAILSSVHSGSMSGDGRGMHDFGIVWLEWLETFQPRREGL
jgi:hypothetical protein